MNWQEGSGGAGIQGSMFKVVSYFGVNYVKRISCILKPDLLERL